jgi:hypothetical protein
MKSESSLLTHCSEGGITQSERKRKVVTDFGEWWALVKFQWNQVLVGTRQSRAMCQGVIISFRVWGGPKFSFFHSYQVEIDVQCYKGSRDPLLEALHLFWESRVLLLVPSSKIAIFHSYWYSFSRANFPVVCGFRGQTLVGSKKAMVTEGRGLLDFTAVAHAWDKLLPVDFAVDLTCVCSPAWWMGGHIVTVSAPAHCCFLTTYSNRRKKRVDSLVLGFLSLITYSFLGLGI